MPRKLLRALAAATALRTTDGSLPQADYKKWHDLAHCREVAS